MSEWVDVCSVADVPAEGGRAFLANGRAIAVWQVDGRYHATDARCPHADGPLADGTLCGTDVTCPMHGWCFDVASGKGLDPNDVCLKTYPVSCREGRILVHIG